LEKFRKLNILFPLKPTIYSISFLFGIIFTFFIHVTPVWALSSAQRGAMLENFKNREYEMIFESDTAQLLDSEDNVFSSTQRINIYNTIGERVQTKKEYLEYQSKKLLNRARSLEESIAELDTDIEDTVKEVNKINANVVDIKNQIDTNKAKVEILKNKIEENGKVLLEYMIYIYKKWDYISDGTDIDSLKTIILSGEELSIVMDDLYFKGIIQVSWQKLIEKHRSFVSHLYVEKITLERNESELKRLRKTLMIEKSILDDKKAAKTRLLEITKGKEELYQKYISEQLAIEKNIKIKELQEQIKLNETKKQLLEKNGCEYVDISVSTLASRSLQGKCLDINKIIYAESKLGRLPLDSNPLSWPVSPSYAGISAYYRDEWYRADFKTDHDAIDIITPQGTEIKAPANGYVVYVALPLTNDYSYVALKHASGLVTIYGHLSEVKVSENDYVSAGQVFALSGGEYGTKWAGFLTTGPHLHFWVYRNKEYADPLEYLDISYLVYEDLSEKYKFKYLADFKARKGYDYKTKETWKRVFKLEGSTEVERQKSLLNTYATKAFNDWNIWVEEAIDAGIDPTFLMCVWLAETTLWNYLKTPFNVGNVGNTDSGSTYSFGSPRNGIYWMTKTFNNKILWKYNEIQELSRYGNKDGQIYASSPENWHTNIVKCMSHIKGEYVPDNYNFRLAK
jgi:murein DD-endopeptidase MepM/ murein hydrolase activator NlpD